MYIYVPTHACVDAFTGVAEAGSCRIDRAGPEANKQLVYQPKEEALEAFRGHAVCGDGCYTPWPLLHGHCLGQPISHGYFSHTALTQQQHAN